MAKLAAGDVTAVAADDIDTWIVAGFLYIDLTVGDLRRHFRRGQLEVLFQRGPGPFVRVRGLRRNQRQGVAQLGEILAQITGDFAQGFVRIIQSLLGRDLVGHRQVVTRLGFLHVRDGNQPHLEPLLCLIELPREGLLLGATEIHIINCCKHVEITLGHAQDQILAR